MAIDYVRLSKTIARALRHAPEEYGLELDSAGWVDVENLLAALRPRREVWRNLTQADLEAMIAQADKQRYALENGRVRAYYGHSIPQAIEKEAAEPPETLYHGTSPGSAARIAEQGLQAMNRQYVHLSTDEATAHMVGSRHAARPVILVVRAREAHAAGVRFYPGNDDVWLADAIPLEFIDIP